MNLRNVRCRWGKLSGWYLVQLFSLAVLRLAGRYTADQKKRGRKKRPEEIAIPTCLNGTYFVLNHRLQFGPVSISKGMQAKYGHWYWAFANDHWLVSRHLPLRIFRPVAILPVDGYVFFVTHEPSITFRQV